MRGTLRTLRNQLALRRGAFVQALPCSPLSGRARARPTPMGPRRVRCPRYPQTPARVIPTQPTPANPSDETPPERAELLPALPIIMSLCKACLR